MDGGAGGGEFFVDSVGRNVAVRDIDDVKSRALAQKSDGRRRGGIARRIKVWRDLGAVAVGFGRADDWIHGVRDAGHVLKEFGDLALFPEELFGVSEMLVLAAAAAGEERADGRDAMGRGREDRDEIGFGVVFMITKNAGVDAFAGETERNHNDPFGSGVRRVGHAGEPDAVVGERHDLEFELGVIRKGEVVVFGFLAHGTHGIHGNRPDQEKDSVFFRFCVFRVFRGPTD